MIYTPPVNEAIGNVTYTYEPWQRTLLEQIAPEPSELEVHEEGSSPVVPHTEVVNPFPVEEPTQDEDDGA